MKSLTVVFGALTALALGACKVETSGSTSTGAGGGSGTTAGVGGAGGGGTTSAATGTGGGPACDAAYTCAEAITDGDATKLCEGPHAVLYDALVACTCMGACKDKCTDTACAGKPASADCTTCLQAAAPDGCKKENDDCSNDAP